MKRLEYYHDRLRDQFEQALIWHEYCRQVVTTDRHSLAEERMGTDPMPSDPVYASAR